MSKARLVAIVSVIGMAAIAVMTIPIAKASSCGMNHKQKPEMDMKNPIKAETLSLEKIHSEHLPMISQSIDKTIEAIEAGNKETALAELHKAQEILALVKDGIGKHVKPKFANIRCPIMGSPINPDKVAENLIRDYNGEKIAFCCGGCPGQWDKLTDSEKDAKLAKVKPEPIEKHSEHKH
ncbi:MAG: hypothetical protein PHP01_05270 [Phycisphaerae bacterium]|nr:hypothetical protein [Phycisphaerae bacterium]